MTLFFRQRINAPSKIHCSFFAYNNLIWQWRVISNLIFLFFAVIVIYQINSLNPFSLLLNEVERCVLNTYNDKWSNFLTRQIVNFFYHLIYFQKCILNNFFSIVVIHNDL